MTRVEVTAMELPMRRWVFIWMAVFPLQTSAHAADKIRISMTGFAGQFMTFPLAQKRGFLKEEGFEAEIIRISAAAGRAALTNGDVDYSTGIGGTAIGGALSGSTNQSGCLLCAGTGAGAGGTAGIQNRCQVPERQDGRCSYRRRRRPFRGTSYRRAFRSRS